MNDICFDQVSKLDIQFNELFSKAVQLSNRVGLLHALLPPSSTASQRYTWDTVGLHTPYSCLNIQRNYPILIS